MSVDTEPGSGSWTSIAARSQPTGDGGSASGARRGSFRRRRGALGSRRPIAPFGTLSRRLGVSHLVIVASVLGILSLAVFGFESRAIATEVDQLLVNEAQHEIPRAMAQLSDTQDARVAESHETPYTPGSPNLFTVTVSASGLILLDDDSVERLGLPDRGVLHAALSGQRTHSFATHVTPVGTFRLYTVALVQDNHIVGALQAGTSLAVYNMHLHDLVVILLLVDAIILLLTWLTSAHLIQRALEPAVESFARQRRFAAAASHEMRTPLALIQSQAEIIAGHERMPDDAVGQQVARDAQEIIDEVEYMTRLVGDLLLLARDEQAQSSVAIARVDVVALARDVATSFESLLARRGLTLSVEAPVDGSDALVLGNADRLRQLLLIVLDNAAQHSASGGAIHVAVRLGRGRHWGQQSTLTSAHARASRTTPVISPRLGPRQHYAEIAVVDTGEGILPEHLPHVFEPFYRARHSDPRPDYGGAGLGLALAQWIVDSHHGQIELTSAPGKGTMVTIRLPLAPHVPRATRQWTEGRRGE